MDVKKSKNASLEDKKLTYLLLGLVVALGLCYIALEWTQSEVVKYEVADEEFLVEEEIEIVQTQQEQQVTPPPLLQNKKLKSWFWTLWIMTQRQRLWR